MRASVDREGLSEDVTLELTPREKGVSHATGRRALQTEEGQFRSLRREGFACTINGRGGKTIDNMSGV